MSVYNKYNGGGKKKDITRKNKSLYNFVKFKNYKNNNRKKKLL